MRISNTGIALVTPVYNLDSIASFDFSVENLAPHTMTVRSSYVIPTDLVGWLKGVFVQVRRAAPASTVGVCGVYFSITLPGGPTVFLYEFLMNDNVVGDYKREYFPVDFQIPGGTTVRIWTSDLSTGGGVGYNVDPVLLLYRRIR